MRKLMFRILYGLWGVSFFIPMNWLIDGLFRFIDWLTDSGTSVPSWTPWTDLRVFWAELEIGRTLTDDEKWKVRTKQ
jgi:hypothetical protein